MKITKKTLQRLIKEELDQAMLDEEFQDAGGLADPGHDLINLTERVAALERKLHYAFKQIARIESAIKPSAWQG